MLAGVQCSDLAKGGRDRTHQCWTGGTGSGLTGLADSTGNGRVFYTGTNHHVLQLKLDPTTNTWTQVDLQAGTSNTVASGSALISLGPAGSSAIHVLYFDSNQHVNDLAKSSSAGTWTNQDLTALTNAGLAVPGSALTGLVDGLANARVYYIGTNLHVLQLKLDPTTNAWTQLDVQAGTGTTVVSGSTLTSLGASGASMAHVLYFDANQHVNDLARNSSGAWTNQDLTALTNAGLAVPGSAQTGLVDSAGNGRVFYMGTNHHVLQLKLDLTNTWTQGDVTLQAGTGTLVANGSGLTSFGQSGGSAVHVLYLDTLQHFNDLVRNSAGATGSWINVDLTTFTGP